MFLNKKSLDGNKKVVLDDYELIENISNQILEFLKAFKVGQS